MLVFSHEPQIYPRDINGQPWLWTEAVVGGR
jgi:hypothetical protein